MTGCPKSPQGQQLGVAHKRERKNPTRGEKKEFPMRIINEYSTTSKTDDIAILLTLYY
jgi:hypothetical protein